MQSKDEINRVVSMRLHNLDERQVSLALQHGLAKIGQCSGCGNEVLLSRTSFHKIAEGYRPTCMECSGYKQREVMELLATGKAKLTKEQIQDVIRFKQIEAAEEAENN